VRSSHPIVRRGARAGRGGKRCETEQQDHTCVSQNIKGLDTVELLRQ
jgi:hypothetical protein